MKTLAVLAAVASASAASGQSDGWIFEFDQAELSPASPTVWVTLSATFDPGDIAFAGARLSVHASESGWGALEVIEPGGSGPGTTPGVASGGDVTGIIVGQVHFPPHFIADPSNPQPVWRGEFTVTDFAERTIDFSTDTTVFRVYRTWPGDPRIPLEAHESIRVVPAPAALALLGLGSLRAARRRR